VAAVVLVVLMMVVRATKQSTNKSWHVTECMHDRERESLTDREAQSWHNNSRQPRAKLA